MALDFYRPLQSLLISRCCGRLSFLALFRIPFLPSVTSVCDDGRRECRECCSSEGWPSSEGKFSASVFQTCSHKAVHPASSLFLRTSVSFS
jgi:hypothetical protein